MKPSTDDKAAGKVHELKGTIKETCGELTDSPELKATGNTEKSSGKLLHWPARLKSLAGANRGTRKLGEREVRANDTISGRTN